MPGTTVKIAKNMVTVENANMFEAERKKYKAILDINAFHFYVEVPLDKVTFEDKKVIKAAEDAADKLEKKLDDELGKLVKKVEDFQDKEKKGDKKAATEAAKAVKSAEKDFKSYPSDFNIEIRKAIQKSLKGDNGKIQLRSVGRSSFKGMEIADGVFQEKAEDEEALKDLQETLQGSSDDLWKLPDEEKKLRGALDTAIGAMLKQFEKSQKTLGDKFDFDEPDKDLTAVINKSIAQVESFSEFLNGAADTIEKTSQKTEKLAKEKVLKGKDNKDVKKVVEDYIKTLDKLFAAYGDTFSTVSRLSKTLQKLESEAAWKDVETHNKKIQAGSNAAKLTGELEKLEAKLQKVIK